MIDRSVRCHIRHVRAMCCVLLLSGCSSDGILGAGESGYWKPGTSSHEVGAGGLARNYLLHVPVRKPLTTSGTVRPYPLLLVLHGSSGTAEDIRQTSQMDTLSELNRFLVAYPSGVRGGGGLYPSDWNAGTCCGAAGRENIDDLGFISALIAQVSKKLAVDPRRVYIAGFSNGGRMAHYAACKLSPKIAAIGVVSGSLKDDTCAPTKPVAVIAVHGTDDNQVAFDDPPSTAPSRPLSGVAAQLPPSVQFWAARNGCGAGTATRVSPNVLRTSFSTCTGAEVMFYRVDGGVHAWPGEPSGSGSQPPMSELRTSLVLTQFFNRQVTR
jgi:polyhydroxybutyrate depolymerase